MLLNPELKSQMQAAHRAHYAAPVVHHATGRAARQAVFALAAAWALVLCLCAPWARAQGKETPLPTPASLQVAAVAATTQREPIVLLVSLPGCPWCELLRRNYLAPMRLEGVQAFQIMVNDRTRMVRDFNGQPNTGAAIAQSYQAKLTPTVLFLDARGQEIAPRIEGVASADLLGAQLEGNLQAARKRLAP